MSTIEHGDHVDVVVEGELRHYTDNSSQVTVGIDESKLKKYHLDWTRMAESAEKTDFNQKLADVIGKIDEAARLSNSTPPPPPPIQTGPPIMKKPPKTVEQKKVPQPPREGEGDYGPCDHCGEELVGSLQCRDCHRLTGDLTEIDYPDLERAVANNNECDCEHCETVRMAIRFGDPEADVWGPGDTGDLSDEQLFALEAPTLEAQIVAQVSEEAMSDEVVKVPMDAVEIASRPTRVVVVAGRCSICRESVEVGSKVLDLGCRHQNHPECLAEWLMVDGRCPDCLVSHLPVEV